MGKPTDPLREEHKGLLPHIEKLRKLADSVGEAPPETLRRDVDEGYAFLTHRLIPHAKAEDLALYPVVAKAMGAPQATATMSRDHLEVGRLTGELERLRDRLSAAAADPVIEKDLRRVLYGLYALVKVHFAKEEEVYLPLLDERLTAGEAQDVFEAMERAAGGAQREPAA